MYCDRPRRDKIEHKRKLRRKHLFFDFEECENPTTGEKYIKIMPVKLSGEQLPILSTPQNTPMENDISLPPITQGIQQEGQIIPYTLSNLDNYIKNSMDSTLNYEQGYKIDAIKTMASVVEPFFKSLFENCDFCIRFKTKNRPSIVKRGFLNVFQTFDKEPDYIQNRLELTKKCFGIDCSGIDPDKLERYGYLCNVKNSSDKEDNIKFYGDNRVTINKDKIFNVTTFTLGDSLNNIGKSIASRVSDPKICSVPGVINGDYDVLISLYEAIKDKKLIKSNTPAFRLCSLLDLDFGYDIKYIDLQYHSAIPWEFVETEEGPKEDSHMPSKTTDDSSFDTCACDYPTYEDLTSASPEMDPSEYDYSKIFSSTKVEFTKPGGYRYVPPMPSKTTDDSSFDTRECDSPTYEDLTPPSKSVPTSYDDGKLSWSLYLEE